MQKIKLLKSLLVSTLGISAIGSIAAISTSCGCGNAIHVISVSLNKSSTTLGVGGTETLTATVLPEDATDKSTTWTSNNPSVATVDSNGKITAVAKGTAIITVTTNDGGKTATCEVTVSDSVIHVTSVSLNKSSTTLVVGGTEILTATVLPEDATDKSVIWTSNNPSVVTVDSNGKITAKKTGTATIFVTTHEGGKTATCDVTVNPIIHVTSVSLNKSSTTLVVGGTEILTATVLPEDATDKSVIWTSNNPSVVTVDRNGKITAISKGTATITATSVDNQNANATCEVTVSDSVIHATSVSLNKSSTTLTVWWIETLTATVLPENVTDKSVTWTSSNPSVAIVDSNGKIYALAKGTATILVATHDGGYTDTCKVTVLPHVTGVKLNKSSTTLAVGGTETLTATVLPEDAADKSVTWTSNNPSVAIVDSNGKITAKGPGTATITVKTNDGGKTATCDVTVNAIVHIHIEPGNNGSVSKTDLTVDKNSTWDQIKSQITATPNPSFEVGTWIITDKSGSYSSDITDDYKFAGDTYLKVLFNRIGNPQVVTTQESKWGDITVKYKLLDNHECRLLTEYGDADEEDGYVSGKGKIVIPDHVIYSNMEPYYIREISSDWSSGENNITGFLFDNVKHLEAICDRAFFHTNALDYYVNGNEGYGDYCCFPEGLKTIGKEAFNGTSFYASDYVYGYSFPSTLQSIGEMAFQYSPYLGAGYHSFVGYLQFRSLVTIGEDAFWNTRCHYVEYVYSTSLELAQQMINILVATEDFYNVMKPALIE